MIFLNLTDKESGIPEVAETTDTLRSMLDMSDSPAEELQTVRISIIANLVDEIQLNIKQPCTAIIDDEHPYYDALVEKLISIQIVFIPVSAIPDDYWVQDAS
jgi:hypothetical protein